MKRSLFVASSVAIGTLAVLPIPSLATFNNEPSLYVPTVPKILHMDEVLPQWSQAFKSIYQRIHIIQNGQYVRLYVIPKNHVFNIVDNKWLDSVIKNKIPRIRIKSEIYSWYNNDGRFKVYHSDGKTLNPYFFNSSELAYYNGGAVSAIGKTEHYPTGYYWTTPPMKAWSPKTV